MKSESSAAFHCSKLPAALEQGRAEPASVQLPAERLHRFSRLDCTTVFLMIFLSKFGDRIPDHPEAISALPQTASRQSCSLVLRIGQHYFWSCTRNDAKEFAQRCLVRQKSTTMITADRTIPSIPFAAQDRALGWSESRGQQSPWWWSSGTQDNPAKIPGHHAVPEVR